jgi:hypothetical protein
MESGSGNGKSGEAFIENNHFIPLFEIQSNEGELKL